MRYFVGLHTQLSDIKILFVDHADIFALHIAETFFHFCPCLSVRINRDIKFTGDRADPRDMVAVFMRDQNAVDILHSDIDLF